MHSGISWSREAMNASRSHRPERLERMDKNANRCSTIGWLCLFQRLWLSTSAGIVQSLAKFWKFSCQFPNTTICTTSSINNNNRNSTMWSVVWFVSVKVDTTWASSAESQLRWAIWLAPKTAIKARSKDNGIHSNVRQTHSKNGSNTMTRSWSI